ncbi:hypothetical protein RIF29_31287 [Crotalaria pallida]|uniref:DUF7787 domain-containing protein n=1 Tax=Crotalaria pallida TaxID=3830 RepID=A0AAN9HX47_CROPI
MESQANHGGNSSSSSSYCSKKPSVKCEKLYLEDYLHFLLSRQTTQLTITQLNQIIRIHGFKKIHHAPKKVLADAVETLDAVDLPRSTLGQNSVSAFAVLTLEDVIADLNELNWQECCVTSLEKLSTWNETFMAPPPPPGFSNQKKIQNMLQLEYHHPSEKSQRKLLTTPKSNTKITPKSKTFGLTPKTRKVDEIYSLIPESFRSSLTATKMVPRRKRSNVYAPDRADGGSTVDSVSLASC